MRFVVHGIADRLIAHRSIPIRYTNVNTNTLVHSEDHDHAVRRENLIVVTHRQVARPLGMVLFPAIDRNHGRARSANFLEWGW